LSVTVDGSEVPVDSEALDGFVAPNLNSGYLTNQGSAAGVTLNFLCPDFAADTDTGGGTSSPAPSASASPAGASGSPAIEPSGSAGASSSP